MSDRVDRDVINALIAGHFADPFSVLGMHRTEAGLEVRALLPDATEVWVIEPKTGRKVANLECLDSRGFFSGIMPRRKNPFRYQLAVIWHGQQNLIDDPYSFGPLLKEMDAWLLSEGTHLRPYETLGAQAGTIDGITGTRSASRLSGSLTTGRVVAIGCACAGRRASGSCLSRGRITASSTNSK